jgi:hypothetical protein
MAIRTFIENLPSVGLLSDPFLHAPFHLRLTTVATCDSDAGHIQGWPESLNNSEWFGRLGCGGVLWRPFQSANELRSRIFYS